MPLPCAHSHNDYEHERPLLDALEQGFCSVEADIHLVNGRLLVAHDRVSVKPERTLERLYLEPLRERVQKHGGRVYQNGPPILLLIDLKSEAEATYRVLHETLQRYEGMLTKFTKDRTETNAVTVVISGNRPRELMLSQTVRYAGFDGRLPDLETNANSHFIPLVSDNWRTVFKWRGMGLMPEDEQNQLREIVSKAHAKGMKIRFWGAPDRPEIWEASWKAGVDLINTDDLKGLRDFLIRAPR
jgi:glycerophosphoryl diester phosphodiesterase